MTPPASIGQAVGGGFELAGEGQRMFDDKAFDGIADRERGHRKARF